jgi:hypothetical protein
LILQAQEITEDPVCEQFFQQHDLANNERYSKSVAKSAAICDFKRRVAAVAIFAFIIVMQRNTVMVQKAALELRQLGQYSLDKLVIAADWTASDAAQWWQRFSNTKILPQSARSSSSAAVAETIVTNRIDT